MRKLIVSLVALVILGGNICLLSVAPAAAQAVCSTPVTAVTAAQSVAPVSVTTIAATDGTDVSSDTITNYRLTIPTKGYNMDMINKGPVVAGSQFVWFGRSSHTVTTILTFPEILYNDAPILMTTAAKMEFPAVFSTGLTIKIEQDLVINIRETYYKYMIGKDFSAFKIMIIVGTEGCSVYRFGVNNSIFANINNYLVHTVPGANLDIYEKPPGSNDPSHPDFELGDNGGVDVSNKVLSWLVKLYNWLTKTFHWSLSFNTFSVLFIVFCVVVVLLIIGGIKLALR